MKKNLFVIALIFSVVAFMTVSCHKKKDSTPNPEPQIVVPVPGEGGTVPTDVLPVGLDTIVTEYFTVHAGENAPLFEGQFVSKPHVLIHSTIEDDTVSVYNDRYIAFFGNQQYTDFYGKQWDDGRQDYYNEVYRKLFVLGTGDAFTTYYLTEGYPNGMFARQSTIFSGKWNESYGGLKDFQVAVILLETSGNPNLAPAGSFRVLGDGDGLAQDTNWIEGTKRSLNDMVVVDDDPFRMFRVK